MSFRAYPAYQESGIDWIGAIPHGWQVKALRSLAREGRTSFIDGDWIETPFIADDGIRLIQTGNVGVGHYREQGFRFISEATFAELACTEVMPGDVLICRLADPVGRACLAPDLGCRMITSVDVCILKPAEDVLNTFIVYLLSSRQYLGFMEGQCRGGTRDRVSRSFLGAVRVPLPHPHEQSAIAAFLDRETGKIDALVAEQERLIALLKEKRQAVISQAVTKGLDPNAPMKDSGVEWLGEVPAHWDVVPLMWLTQPARPIMYGIVLPGPDVEDGIPIMKGGNVRPSRLNLQSMARTTAEIEAPYARARLRSGDLVYSIRGSIGDCEIVPEELEGSNITQDVARVAPRPDINPEWLRFALLSAPVREALASGSLGAAVRGINIFDLKRARIATPPPEERRQIAERLRSSLSALETLSTEAERAVTLLKERRAALISAAVTGKIDVRGLVSPAEAQAA